MQVGNMCNIEVMGQASSIRMLSSATVVSGYQLALRTSE
jgi:hypothetical protein